MAKTLPHLENKSTRSDWIANALLMGFIWGFGRLSLYSAIPPEWRSLIWAPTGIALAFVLHRGYRMLPGVFIGTFLIQRPLFPTIGPPLVVAFSSVLSAAVSAYLLHAFKFRQGLRRLTDAYRLLIFAGIGSSLINAALESAALLLVRPLAWPDYSILLIRLWQSHTVGILLFTPLFLTWLNHPPTRFALSKVAEATFLLLLLFASGIVVYMTGGGRITYLPFPFIIWAAFRLERRATLLVSLLINAAAAYLTSSDVTTNWVHQLNTSPDATWFFMIAVMITAVSLSIANHERQVIKNELQLERDFAQQVMRHMGQGITITGQEGRFEYVNNAFAATLGYAPHELIGLQPSSLVIAADVQQIEKAFAVTQSTEDNQYEVRLQHQDGRYLHTLITSVPRLSGNQPVGVIAVITDLTDRNKTEQKLRQSEQQYKNLFDAARRQTQELELLGRIHAALARELDLSVIYKTVVNALADTFGYDQVSLYARQGNQLILQHQRGFTQVYPILPLNHGIIGRVMRTGEPIRINDIQLNSDHILPKGRSSGGSEICVPLFNETEIVGAINIESTRTQAFSTADMHLLTMLSEHVSIAIARTYLYEEVLHNEKRFRALIEHNPATISLYDAQGNPKPQQFLNLHLTETPGTNLLDPATIHPEDVKLVQETFTALLAAPDGSKSLTHRNQTPDGRIRWMEKTFTNLLHEPAVQAIVVNARDITDRKEAEDALLQSQKLESLGVLAGGIAHDFNNLLVAMMGQVSLAKIKANENSKAQPHLIKAYSAIEKASKLTQQLLAYSGHGQFQIETINLNALIQENMHLFMVGLPKSVTIQSRLHKDLPPIRGDVGQMQQIIMNLIINGAEAIGEQGGTVQIGTGIQTVTSETVKTWPVSSIAPSPGQYVRLTVADNGDGMDEITLAKIFDPFFTTKFTGRGLGLAAVQGIIRGHQGGLLVTSKPNRGSTFALYFPMIAKNPADSPQVQALREETAAYTPNSQPNNHNHTTLPPAQGTILVIDDELAVRDTLTDILSNESFQVLTAVTRQDGIDQFQVHHKQVRLIILDLSMPGLTIKDTINQLRRTAPRIAILISSGYSEAEAKAQLHGYHVAGFLQKPYNIDDLLSCVRAEMESGLTTPDSR